MPSQILAGLSIFLFPVLAALAIAAVSCAALGLTWALLKTTLRVKPYVPHSEPFEIWAGPHCKAVWPIKKVVALERTA